MANTTDFAVEKPTVGGYRNTWGGTLNTGLDKLTELLALALPIGTIQIYTKSTAPTATTNGGTWLVCDGTAISRTTYASLFSTVGVTFGVGDGSNTFNLPDLRTRVPLGYSTATVGSGDSQRTPKNTIGATGGEEKHTLTEAELDNHTHPLPTTAHSHPVTEPNGGAGHSHTGNASGKTGNASTGITLDDHDHAIQRWHDSGGSGMHQVAISYLSQGAVHSTWQSNTAKSSVTDPEHNHPITTNQDVSGISVDNAVTGITATSATGSSTAHENLPPYQVFTYIILAKHPTFT